MIDKKFQKDMITASINEKLANIEKQKTEIELMEENRRQLDLQVIPQNSGYVQEGELIEKKVTHDETILTISDDITLILPNDLDDFVKVGAYLKITIEEI